MNLLDENIRRDQGEQLRRWRIRFRWVVGDLARAGIQDADVISLLHRCKQPTLFTHDQDYFQRRLVHRAYSLVWLDAYDGEAATLILRFLRHPEFDTHAKRLGKVIRLHAHAITFWALGDSRLHGLKW